MPSLPEPGDWAVEEFGAADLGDARRKHQHKRNKQHPYGFQQPSQFNNHHLSSRVNSISKSPVTLSTSPCRTLVLSAAHLRVTNDL
jgi:hypothetical protein